ncbi:uncharacterized protein [Setaria viridis]|uniref:uncharacterized protein n=1 Tax=Setaria viridis TaxID=4556 RepID=UPI003B3A4790
MFKNTAKELQSWSQRNVGQIKLQLLVAKTVVHWLDKAQEERQLTMEEHQLRKELKLKSLGLSSLERTMIRLRSRISYLRDGDANTHLFHMQAGHRAKKKFITRLQHGEHTAVTHEDKETMLFQHFNSILSTASDRTELIDLAALNIQPVDLHQLDCPFSEAEVWGTLRSLPNDKAPGPDGFTVEFYRVAWPVIKEAIMAAFNAFYRNSCAHLRRLNGNGIQYKVA